MLTALETAIAELVIKPIEGIHFIDPAASIEDDAVIVSVTLSGVSDAEVPWVAIVKTMAYCIAGDIFESDAECEGIETAYHGFCLKFTRFGSRNGFAGGIGSCIFIGDISDRQVYVDRRSGSCGIHHNTHRKRGLRVYGLDDDISQHSMTVMKRVGDTVLSVPQDSYTDVRKYLQTS